MQFVWLVPHIFKGGKSCYKALFGRSGPCTQILHMVYSDLGPRFGGSGDGLLALWGTECVSKATILL